MRRYPGRRTAAYRKASRLVHDAIRSLPVRVAVGLGVSGTHVAAIRRGERHDFLPSTLAKLCERLGIAYPPFTD